MNNPDQRPAHAPYNFVPLPANIAPANEGEIPGHHTFQEGTHTGYFDIRITTRSPLYIRGPLTTNEFRQAETGNEDQQRAMKNKPDFFYTDQQEMGDAAIPGSSLRGMLRSIIEIITFSKLHNISRKNLFFRTVDNSSIGIAYRTRMVGDNEFGNKVEAGFLRRDAQGYYIKICQAVRVSRNLLNIEWGGNPNFVAPWKSPSTAGHHQYQRVWIRLGEKKHLVGEIRNTPATGNGWSEAILVITGNAPRKKKEFVFLLPNADSEIIRVSDEMIDRFQDDDQISQWQQKAFPKKEPMTDARERDGYLSKQSNGEENPIFFLREEDEHGKRMLSFIGRAQIFRLPYKRNPHDFVPGKLTNPQTIDMAEAIFGYIPDLKDKKRQRTSSRAGRVFFGDARLYNDQENIWLGSTPDQVIVPQVFSTPKPTAFQNYLEQPAGVMKNKMRHYEDTPGENMGGSRRLYVRGHKRYWLRGNVSEASLVYTGDRQKFRKQLTQIKPIRADVDFFSRIYFENLTPVELGALVWALVLPHETECCHSLGMGKPLGMGAVKLKFKLILTDRSMRYSKLFDDEGEWLTTEQRETRDQYLGLAEEFEKHVETTVGKRAFHERMAALLKMMEWRETLTDAQQQARSYMTLEEFRNKPVLPGPLDIKD